MLKREKCKWLETDGNLDWFLLTISLLTIGLKIEHFPCFVEKVQVGRFSSDAQLNSATV